MTEWLEGACQSWCHDLHCLIFFMLCELVTIVYILKNVFPSRDAGGVYLDCLNNDAYFIVVFNSLLRSRAICQAPYPLMF